MGFFKKPKIQDLINEAAKIGGLRVWQYRQGHPYEVTIHIASKGIRIDIISQHKDLCKALQSVIEKAKSLKRR